MIDNFENLGLDAILSAIRPLITRYVYRSLPLQETKDASLEDTLEYLQHVRVCHVVKLHGTTAPVCKQIHRHV